MALCAGPFVEPKRIVKVAGSTDWLVRAAVARNLGTPPNLLKKLSLDAHPLVSSIVAARLADEARAGSIVGTTDAGSGTLNLSRVVEEVLRRMRTDGRGWACVPLANSKAWRDLVSIHEFLSWLKRHEEFDEVVDQFIGELDDAGKELFWRLVTESQDGEVRMRLVRNHAVPMKTLEKFVAGESVDVLLVIASKSGLSRDLQLRAEKAAIRLITRRGKPYRRLIARNCAYLTGAMRDRLEQDSDLCTRGEIGHAQSIPYPEWMTQPEIPSWNDGTSSSEINELECQYELARSSVPEARRQRTINWLSQLRSVFQREIQVHQGAHVFATGQVTVSDVSNALLWLGYIPASDKVAPSESARSTDWLTRLGAALHQGVTQGILKMLRRDVDPDVAQAVQLREVGSWRLE